MYSFSSASHTRAPLPRTMYGGSPLTDLNARTGESTPPGITRQARACSSWDFFRCFIFCHLNIPQEEDRRIGRLWRFASLCRSLPLAAFSSRCHNRPCSCHYGGHHEKLPVPEFVSRHFLSGIRAVESAAS